MDDANVGPLDMLLRFLLAMALFTLATFLNGNWRWLALLGFFPLMTSALRFCPLWKALGICTCHEGKEVTHRIAH